MSGGGAPGAAGGLRSGIRVHLVCAGALPPCRRGRGPQTGGQSAFSGPCLAKPRRWRQYRFHVEDDDNEVVVSVAMEGEAGTTGRASFDLFLKAEQPAGG